LKTLGSGAPKFLLQFFTTKMGCVSRDRNGNSKKEKLYISAQNRLCERIVKGKKEMCDLVPLRDHTAIASPHLTVTALSD